MKNLTAILCLTLAVLLGSAGMSWSADLQKGLDAYKNKDYATAMREWKPLAEQGNATAQFNLSEMYNRGRGVPQNHKTALEWIQKSAENGNKYASFRLGGMYNGTLLGHGIPKDREIARKWWKLAAEQGHSGAQEIMNISVPWWKFWAFYGWWRFW
jgi:TPR repeat protein